MRSIFVVGSIIVVCLLVSLAMYVSPLFLFAFIGVGPVIALGIADMLQVRQTIRRNFPVVGNFRYLFEMIRPEINQYFVESNSDGVPFSREQRSIVYQRSKLDLDSLPFGTQKNVYEVGYEWLTHSLAPVHVDPKSLRVLVGGRECKQPYSASIFNVSAMSFGALSKNAIMALNGGAKIGGFYHNTGEGGLSPYHLSPGGDLVWQIGTGYFSCRDEQGNFSPELFHERATLSQIKMIEIKLSQGAKPSHGGILPAKKVSPEVAAIRLVPLGKDVLSPPAHTAFDSPIGLLNFVQKLRELSGGKPVGFKLCIGKRREFMALAKAMVQTQILPDFITIDGGEGGTGAAPLEFSNHVGYPLREGLIFVHNTLVGMNLRKDIRLIASGRNITAFDLVTRFAIGADICNSARGMMLALGCIQALRCNSNHCPTGVATQNPGLVAGLDVTDKRRRVANFQAQTVGAVAELVGAMGLKSASDIRPFHVVRRTSAHQVQHYGEIYEFLEPGVLLQEVPPIYKYAFENSRPDSFAAI